MDPLIILLGLIIVEVALAISCRKELKMYFDNLAVATWKKWRMDYYQKRIGKQKLRLSKAKSNLSKIGKTKSREVFEYWEDELDEARYFLGSLSDWLEINWENMEKSRWEILKRDVKKAERILAEFEKYTEEDLLISH